MRSGRRGNLNHGKERLGILPKETYTLAIAGSNSLSIDPVVLHCSIGHARLYCLLLCVWIVSKCYNDFFPSFFFFFFRTQHGYRTIFSDVNVLDLFQMTKMMGMCALMPFKNAGYRFEIEKVEIWNYFLKIQWTISTTLTPILGLFVLILMHLSCWIQIWQ